MCFAIHRKLLQNVQFSHLQHTHSYQNFVFQRYKTKDYNSKVSKINSEQLICTILEWLKLTNRGQHHSVLLKVFLEIQSQNSCAEQQNKDSVKLFQSHSVVDLSDPNTTVMGMQQACPVVQLHTLYVLQTYS